MQSTRVFLSCVMILLVGLLIGSQLGPALTQDREKDSVEKLGRALEVISSEYVDNVDSAELTEKAIVGMLTNLDPHSVYISSDRMRAVEESFDASFEGIGISYELVGGSGVPDTIVVLNVISGGPSESAGVVSGDRIMEVDGREALDLTHDEVQNLLKGPKGSEVTIGVRRMGESDLMQIAIERDEVPIYTVDSAYMVNDRTGYIKINRFARTTHDEFIRSMNTLVEDGMEQLILDLRGNAGGFMNMAVRVVDEFLPAGLDIVAAKSRHSSYNEEIRSSSGGLFEGKPIIVLVNEHSASASEIVAGALQDHDRGLIVGQRTFGKGLVQKQFELRDGSALRLTISRFYTPSGRLIQTPYDDGRESYLDTKQLLQEEGRTLDLEELATRVPDSLQYQTANGRIVIGGGGILPDVIVKQDTTSSLLQALVRNNVIDTYARSYIDQNANPQSLLEISSVDYMDRFQVSDEMIEDLLHLADERGVEAADLRDDLIRGGSRVAEPVDDLLKTHLKARIALRLYGTQAYYPIMHQADIAFREAMNSWDELSVLAERN